MVRPSSCGRRSRTTVSTSGSSGNYLRYEAPLRACARRESSGSAGTLSTRVGQMLWRFRATVVVMARFGASARWSPSSRGDLDRLDRVPVGTDLHLHHQGHAQSVGAGHLLLHHRGEGVLLGG